MPTSRSAFGITWFSNKTMRAKSIKSVFLALIFFMGVFPVLSSSGSQRSLIPAGEFLMGTEEGTEMEQPVHRVRLKEFYIDRYEVSNDEYQTFRPDHPRSALSACDQCPVTIVNWHDADKFCRHRGGRLPTEAEWERAARGTQGFAFAFGATPDRAEGHFGLPFKTGAIPVNSPPPNDFSLHHMTGNVWEWVNDWSASYPSGIVDNPTGPSVGDKKILRGGSWYSAAYYLNVGLRFELNPVVKLNSIGFRCVSSQP
ncbi:MAG: SUMF1/EgtB/PvdO family nonheme iron enzyme [Nitrospinota bacterium]|nr:SUMF1/EgtB/PvdO family nonheme iron enzyme [Nitrospinota bacterium]